MVASTHLLARTHVGHGFKRPRVQQATSSIIHGWWTPAQGFSPRLSKRFASACDFVYHGSCTRGRGRGRGRLFFEWQWSKTTGGEEGCRVNEDAEGRNRGVGRGEKDNSSRRFKSYVDVYIYIYIFSSIAQPWIFLKYFNLPVFAWVWNIP